MPRSPKPAPKCKTTLLPSKLQYPKPAVPTKYNLLLASSIVIPLKPTEGKETKSEAPVPSKLAILIFPEPPSTQNILPNPDEMQLPSGLLAPVTNVCMDVPS